MLAFWRTVAMWVFSIPYWTVLLTVYVVSLRSLPWAFVARASQVWGRVALRILGIRLVWENEPPFVATREPRVLIFNHQSGLDVIWGATVCPLAPLAIGKKEVIWIPMLNLVFWLFRFIRIDRSNREKALASLQGVAQKVVQDRRTLVISPEGTRAPDGVVLPFRKGAFFIAIEAQVPLYPMVISGAGRLNPKGRFIMRPGVIRMKFLPPYATRGLTQESKDALIERVRGDMVREYEALRQKG